jgi:FkbM family methyltransferase
VASGTNPTLACANLYYPFGKPPRFPEKPMSNPVTLSPEAASVSAASQPTGLRRRDLLTGLLGAAGGAAALALTQGQLRGKGNYCPEGAQVSYAQFGEDLVAFHLLSNLLPDLPTYLDIGASEPVKDSNTFLFYTAGCRGVLVEPNVGLSERIRKARPGDKLLVAGIGTGEEAEADYYAFDQPGLNTFDKEQADRVGRELNLKLLNVVKMPLLNINRVIAENLGGKAPDFVSIDIEGLDYAVLKTLDFKKYRPKLICAETIITNTLRHNPDTTRLLIESGYEIRGMTRANTLYMDKAFLGG